MIVFFLTVACQSLFAKTLSFCHWWILLVSWLDSLDVFLGLQKEGHQTSTVVEDVLCCFSCFSTFRILIFHFPSAKIKWRGEERGCRSSLKRSDPSNFKMIKASQLESCVFKSPAFLCISSTWTWPEVGNLHPCALLKLLIHRRSRRVFPGFEKHGYLPCCLPSNKREAAAREFLHFSGVEGTSQEDSLS